MFVLASWRFVITFYQAKHFKSKMIHVDTDMPDEECGVEGIASVFF